MGTIDPIRTKASAPAGPALWEWQRDGKTQGPEQLSTLEAWAKQGAMLPSDQFRRVGEPAWRSLANVPELSGAKDRQDRIRRLTEDGNETADGRTEGLSNVFQIFVSKDYVHSAT